VLRFIGVPLALDCSKAEFHKLASPLKLSSTFGSDRCNFFAGDIT
jgi:hypothetical protein